MCPKEQVTPGKLRRSFVKKKHYGYWENSLTTIHAKNVDLGWKISQRHNILWSSINHTLRIGTNISKQAATDALTVASVACTRLKFAEYRNSNVTWSGKVDVSKLGTLARRYSSEVDHNKPIIGKNVPGYHVVLPTNVSNAVWRATRCQNIASQWNRIDKTYAHEKRRGKNMT